MIYTILMLTGLLAKILINLKLEVFKVFNKSFLVEAYNILNLTGAKSETKL